MHRAHPSCNTKNQPIHLQVQHFAFDEKQADAVVERAKNLFVIFDAGYDLFDAPFDEFKQDLVAAVFSRMLYNNLDTN